MKKISWIIVAMFIITGVWFFFTKPAQAPQEEKSGSGVAYVGEEEKQPEERSGVVEEVAGHKDIRVTSLKAGDAIDDPVVLAGEAKGLWYFEGGFPIELLDANEKLLGNGFAEAQGEWMTEAFVPFTVTFNYEAPTTPTGVLVLHKDNPSGNPEMDDELRINVTF